MCGPILEGFAKVVRDDGNYSLAEQMLSYVPKIYKNVKDLLNGEWNNIVVTHGDAWFNNFLFKWVFCIPTYNSLQLNEHEWIHIQHFINNWTQIT